MKLYFTTTNNGDGSASVEWFDDPAIIEWLEEEDPETYGMGEGGSYIELIDHVGDGDWRDCVSFPSSYQYVKTATDYPDFVKE